jgi:glycosyltransferase involved in cell wall biosynthesis
MNLRILIYINPSNINKVTHKFNLDGDSGFIMVTKSIDSLNKNSDNHYYLLVPNKDFTWEVPNNVTLIEYPYINDALNSRYHFDTIFLNKYFNTYRHDIDLCWTMIPENVSNLKAFFNKRREEIPIFCYSNWLQNSNSSYEPNYKFRTLEGIVDCKFFGYQSTHMLAYMDTEIFKDLPFDKNSDKLIKIHPKTDLVDNPNNILNDIIVFNHRISNESNFSKMYKLIQTELDMELWVTNINNGKQIEHPNIRYESISDRESYFNELKKVRFGVSYHIGYSMWCMSVLDLMSCSKVVLVPKKSAFIEMMGEDYEYFFENNEEFISKFKELQTIDKSELKRIGESNRLRVEKLFTWDVMGEELNTLFIKAVTTKTTDKTRSVYSVIKKHNAITKGELINKNLTSFGRMCSRAWNKARIELMRDFNVFDDTNQEETTFYINRELYMENGTSTVEKVKTAYELKQLKLKESGLNKK